MVQIKSEMVRLFVVEEQEIYREIYKHVLPSRASIELLRVSANEEPGKKNAHWNGRDEDQRRVANGCYFIKLEADDDVDVQKIVFIK